MFGFSKKVKEPDWDRAYLKLLEATSKAIGDFSSKHPDRIVSDICYDSEPEAGYVLVAFNTEANDSKDFRKRNSASNAYIKEQLVERYDNWKENAHYFLKSKEVRRRGANPGYFDFQDFADVDFPEWVEYIEQELPDRPSHEDDYLESRVAFLFWRVMDTLVNDDCFEDLLVTSDFQLSYCFHDQDPVVLFTLGN